jgi:hypothetical protein
MKSLALVTALASAVVALAPAQAATVVTYGATNPGTVVGAVTLTPAGPGSVASPISFDVSGNGDFSATFSFINPYSVARANGSASFNFDPDVLNFTRADFSGTNATLVTVGNANGLGSSIQVDLARLGAGLQYLNLVGTLNPNFTPAGGNDFARVGGSLTLTQLSGAVPEPATWALFILGFGTIGASLRRRSSAVRANKAKMHFA